MTTEPKFVPEEAVTLHLTDHTTFRVRLVDCVGYIVPSAVGYIEEEQPRMVRTPWYEEEIPFNMAAEIGTKKVITEHSTIGLVVTTDGTITSIPRAEYEEAEERVIEELKSYGKPFVVLLNSETPTAAGTVALAAELTEKYGVPVLPGWIKCLDDQDPWKTELFAAVQQDCHSLSTIDSVKPFIAALAKVSRIESVQVRRLDLSTGDVQLDVQVDHSYFYQVLSEKCGLTIANERQLMEQILQLVTVKQRFARFEQALADVENSGYGIVMPAMDEMHLDEPEIMKQGGRYGVKLRAQAPSIHMIRCNTYTEVAPIVGSESQSQELVMYLLKEFEQDPAAIWNTNLFGKPLLDLVNEGLNNKLYRMPEDARNKFRETIERVINEGCSGLICIIL